MFSVYGPARPPTHASKVIEEDETLPAFGKLCAWRFMGSYK